MFNKLHEKNYHNNLLDVDAAVTLISEFKTDDPTLPLKHNNACGLLQETISDAYNVALACDPTSAGGVLITMLIRNEISRSYCS
jgi:phosphoribosylaminoimidazolecarboxamide formyltransferase/IMP cyclohydrolase